MPLRLRVIPPSSRQTAASGDAVERAIDFDDGVGQIRIGRRADLELSLPFAPLSGVHARLVRASDSADKADRWLLEDLGSTNGTFVGGERLKPGVKLPVTAGTQIKFAEVKLIFDGHVRAKGDAAVEVDGSNKTIVQGEASNKVQGEASNKATGKTGSEVSSKSGGKVQGEASNKATGKTGSEVSSKSGGKVQGEASNKATGKTGSEVSSKSGGKVQGEASNKATGKTGSEVSSKSGGKVPPNDPTQTYVQPQFTDVFSSAADGGAGPVPDRGLRHHRGRHVFPARAARSRLHVRANPALRVPRQRHRRVARARVVRTPRGQHLRDDLGSVNGVLVNNTRVKEYRLCDGDLIQIGHVKLRLFDPSEPSPRESEQSGGSSPLSRSTPSRSVPSPASRRTACLHSAPPRRHAHIEPPSRALRAAARAHRRVRRVPFGSTRRSRASWPPKAPATAAVPRCACGSGALGESNGFRYAIVSSAASILAVCAVLVGFSLAG